MATRFCEECGAQLSEGKSFCGGCGAEAGQPSPEASGGATATPALGDEAPTHVAAQQSAEPAPGSPGTPKRSRRKGCAIGCLIVALLLACVALLLAGWFFQWPQQLGLVESPGETLFESSPDPYAADAILLELARDVQIAPKGLSIYVVPTKQDEMVAYVLVEEADGFVWNGPTFDNAIEGLLIFTAATEAAAEFEIDRVAVDYRGADGEQIAVMTAPVDALVGVALGEVTQDELFEQMNGRAGGTPSISLGGE